MRKFPVILACASVVAFLTPQLVVIDKVHATTTLPTKNPTQDAIWDTSGVTPDIDTDYVGYSGVSTYGKQRSAIQFDLSDVSQNIGKATLRIYVNDWQDGDTTDSVVPTVTVIGSTTDAWAADPTHSAFPMNAGDASLDGTKTVPGSITSPVGGWMEFNVTNFVKNELATNKIVTFALIGEETKSAVQFGFASDNNADPTLRPQLVLETAATTLSPVVTNATTPEDTQTSSGLKITPNAADSAVTHYMITGITGGRLYKHDGITEIHNGDFITAAEGNAELKFNPDPDANSSVPGRQFSFNVQAALDSTGTGLSAPSPAIVTVTEVNDVPVPHDDTLSAIDENSGDQVFSFASLVGNDSKGAANENAQTLTVDWAGEATGGSVKIDGQNVIFTPDANYYGPASFHYTVQDNGTTNGAADPKSSTVKGTASFTINQVAHVPIVTDATTAEDTQSTTGLKITPNAADGTSVTHYMITGITGGTLYKQDGVTAIHNGEFITEAEGTSGLKYTPAANANTPAGDTFSFQVQAALDGAGKGLSAVQTATVTVTEVNDAPTATDDLLSAIDEDSGDRTIAFADLLANDSTGPTNESGQQLTITSVSPITGGSVRIQGTNVIFTPDANFNGTASFEFTVQDNGTTNGAAAPQTATATASFPITPVADTPSVTNAVTPEDTQTTGGLVIWPNPIDGAEVTHYKITEITGGTLYKHDGGTLIHNGDYITLADGTAGLKFTPDANANSTAGGTFSFKAQAALDNAGTGLSAVAATATINVSEINDVPHPVNDALSSVPENSAELAISVDDLIANDSAGPADESGQTLTVTSVGNSQGGTVVLVGSVVHFTPDTNYHGAASFDYTVTDNGTTDGAANAQSATATASFTIDPRADMPSVINALTVEDTQTSSGLVITPTAGTGATTTHFKISEITGGKLYMNDGITQIQNGEYITVAEGGAGLKFTPDADANGTTGFGFKVQAAPGTDGTLLSDAVYSSIQVSEVNDAPIVMDDNLDRVAIGTPSVDIPLADLTANDLPGPANESDQSQTVTDAREAVGGTVTLIGDHVQFVPDANFTGQAQFTYTVTDNGRTNGTAEPKSASAIARFYLVDQGQPTITLNGANTVYLLKGQPYAEPGYSAYDDVDKDLTDLVTVTGSVNTNELGTYQLHYNVSDKSGNAAPEAVRTVEVVSDDLANFMVSKGTLKPAFDPATQEYTLSVPANTPDLTISAATSDPTATLTINGEAKGAGGSKTVKLNTGKNDVNIVVTAQGGETKKYHMVVTRPLILSPSGSDSGWNDGPGSVRQGDIDTGESGDGSVVRVDISRTHGTGGDIVDSVVLNAAKADEVVRQAAGKGGKTARIVIKDVPGKPADAVTVNVSGAALTLLNAAHLGLVIEAGGSHITLSSQTLSQMGQGGQDLYFRVVPVRQSAARQQLEQRVAGSQIIKNYAHGTPVQIFAQPMTIDTNYSSRKTNVQLPLSGVNLPSDPTERAAFLSRLAVYVEHSDGEKLVQNGNIVYDAAGNPVGMEIEVHKFSTFTVISADVQSTTYARYISGYPDGKFRPMQNMTRAELASILALQLKQDQGAATPAKQFADVSGSHWAFDAIQALQAAGIMSGDGNERFRPDQAVTRAELATITARLKKLDTAGTLANFQDAKDHWAAAAIAAVKQAGLMNGYADGTFRPNRSLNRAEAVTVLNRLFDRPALKNAQQSSWPDVSLTDWYSSDVESASHDMRKFSDGRIEQVGDDGNKK